MAVYRHTNVSLSDAALEKTRRIAGEVAAAHAVAVDDEPVVRRTAQNALERYGYNVIAAENGLEAVEIFRNRHNDIRAVLLDLTMPVVGGEEAIERMRGIKRDVTIVLSSGVNEIESFQRFAGKGLAGFIQKPYAASKLIETLAGALERSSG